MFPELILKYRLSNENININKNYVFKMSKEKTITSLFVRVSSLARLGTKQVPGFYISPKLSMRLLRFGKRSGTIGQSTSHRDD